MRGFIFFLTLIGLAACGQTAEQTTPSPVSTSEGLAVATFAGGCFWCVESDFEKLAGVNQVISGYIGGRTENPTYKQVSSGASGHVEAVEIHYDPQTVSYLELVEHLWRHIDPTDNQGQFVDRGKQYAPYIFYHNAEQQQVAEQSKQKLEDSQRFKRPIATPIVAATTFYAAEEYHQDYYQKSPIRYKYYRYNSGRDQFLRQYWPAEEQSNKQDSKNSSFNSKTYSKPSEETLRKRLDGLQFYVTQEDGTEPAFKNPYWNEKRDGIYVDIVSGEPLFSSLDKYDSKTGWPSFTRPIEGIQIVEKTDYKLLYPRTEVRSHYADSHLGHVFKDGPAPTGLRYCINSAALKFISKEQMQALGYGELLTLFKSTDH